MIIFVKVSTGIAAIITAAEAASSCAPAKSTAF